MNASSVRVKLRREGFRKMLTIYQVDDTRLANVCDIVCYFTGILRRTRFLHSNLFLSNTMFVFSPSRSGIANVSMSSCIPVISFPVSKRTRKPSYRPKLLLYLLILNTSLSGARVSSCHVINHKKTAVSDSFQPLPPKRPLLENLTPYKQDEHGGFCWEMIVIVVDVVVDMLMSVC